MSHASQVMKDATLPASTRAIRLAVLAYRDGVLESTSQILTRHDAKQIKLALALVGRTATIERIIEVGKPFHP